MLNKDIKELVRLSEIDRQLDSFAPKIDAANEKLQREKSKIESAEEEIAVLRKQIEENDDKIATYEEQIKALDEQLASIKKKGTEISSEKEMKALAEEEEIAKGKLAFDNEEIERLQEINEKKSALIEDLETSLEEMRKSFAEVSAETEEILSSIDGQKAELFAKRDEIIRRIDQRILAFYEKIRKRAGNTAVVPIRKQACYGCYLKINDKTYAEVIKGDELTSCTHCGRIIYLEESPVEHGED